MTNQQVSNQDGVLKEGMIELQPDMQSTNAESRSTLDTLDSTVPLSPNFQATENSKEDMKNPNASFAQLIMAFAGKLGKLVEWRKIKLGDGREGYALFFELGKWEVDPVSKELLPR